ncbi:3-keto-disaccharide hydrolase [Novipirellula maiorica]|uniref:3-keto-disaccharide hydrolase n=1 Tax=Novipirellula maiorica TaxID=1265734 RepID=UPI0009DB6D4E|nr:DUF1080 domain-containing protein [Rhodopirellula maiorica]
MVPRSKSRRHPANRAMSTAKGPVVVGSPRNNQSRTPNKNNSWNRFVVRAVGDRIQTWVNGTKIADFSDAESSKKGFFGLQVHGIAKGSGPFEVRWKDIRVRELK